MRFELPGLSVGPTDTDLKRLERHRLVIQAPDGTEGIRAAALGLSVEEFCQLRESLSALRRR